MDIANYLTYYFSQNSGFSRFEMVSIRTIEKLIQVSKENPSGVDNFDVKLLKPVAELITLPISYIIHLCF